MFLKRTSTKPPGDSGGKAPLEPQFAAGFLLRKAGGSVVTRTKGSYSKGPEAPEL